MRELFFITKSLALKIHEQQIERFGGMNGIRDNALLESASGAAQYCYSITHNHPFLDGNKRTATACMLVFLVKNGIQPTFTNRLLYDSIILVTTNKMPRTELANLLKQHSKLITS